MVYVPRSSRVHNLAIVRTYLTQANRRSYFHRIHVIRVEAPMKLILAIIQPTKLQAVREALNEVGVERLTVCDAQGYGRQRGQPATYRGIEYKVNLLRKIALEIWVNDDFVERTVSTLLRIARTGSEGNIGDGKVFVLPTEDAYTIDGSARGPGAI